MTNPLLHAEQLILSEFLQSGLASARPAATGSHKYYFETDNNALYQDQGTWVAIAIPPTGGVDSVTGDGVDNSDPANPVISYPTPGDIGAATSAQGALADTALQPADVGSAAYQNTTAFDAAGAASTAETNAKAYADGLVVGLWDDRGAFDASGGAYPSTGGSGTAGAITKGDIWTVSVAGTLPTGQVVEIGDVVRALIDAPGNTQANWAIQQNNIGYTAENSANKSTDVETDKTSNVKYPSVKAVYDWAIGLFTATRIGTLIHGTSAKTAILDADEFGIADSGASFSLGKVTWLAIKNRMKLFMDGIYLALDGNNDPITGNIEIHPTSDAGTPLKVRAGAASSRIIEFINHIGTIWAWIDLAGNFYANTINAGTINGSIYTGLPQSSMYFGDGHHGDINFDGTNKYSFATLTDHGDGTYTYQLTSGIHGNTILVQPNVTLITAGYRIFAKTSFDCSGITHNNGSDASGSTAGAGALGGFFKAGGAGRVGLLAASAGANGTAPVAPTANTLVGSFGGRGACGRVSNITFEGTNASIAGAFPTAENGGWSKKSSIEAYLQPYHPSGAAANWQMTPSVGGGAGAKSTTGTAAFSGGGGGGGGIVYIASPFIVTFGSGEIQAKGGNGGNAGGTGGNFGGGGGGGGGIVCLVSCNDASVEAAVNVSGGLGGVSVAGTNSTYTVTSADVTVTGATARLQLPPTACFNRGTLYMIAVHIQVPAPIVVSVQNMSGFGLTFGFVDRVLFNTIANPARQLELWYALRSEVSPLSEGDDGVAKPEIVIELDGMPTNCRVMIDTIQNVDLTSEMPFLQQANNSIDSGTTLTVTMPNAITTPGNLTYSVFARSGGTTPVAGTGNTLVNNQTVAPIMVSEVAIDRAANSMSHTTAAAIAAISCEIAQALAMENGIQGWNGQSVRLRTV